MGGAERGVFARSSTLTVLFTDVVGSTELLDRMGEEAAASTMRRHFELMRAAVRAEGGEEVKSLGDGLMVVFRSVLAAVNAGVAMQRSLAERAAAGDDVLGLRVGIHMGEAAPDDHDWQGGAVVIAKRLCDLAGANEILCSDVVRQVVGRGFGVPFAARGDTVLKGLQEPVAAHEVLWSATADVTGAAPLAAEPAPLPLPAPLGTADVLPFVGREQELARLAAAWEAVTTGGRPRLLVLAGTAGIGKSTLARHFTRALHDAGTPVLFGRCDPDAVVPFQPFAEAVRHLPVGDVLARLPSPVRAELGRLAPGVLGADAGRRAAGADPGLDRYLLFDAVAQLLAAIAERGPFVLVVDDLHWAGEATVLLLRHVLLLETPLPVLVLATVRDDEPDEHGLGSLVAHLRRLDLVERVALGGLGPGEVGQLVEASGQEAEQARTVYERSEGNPFFVRALIEQLAHGSDALPEGVLDVVRDRLDRLSPTARQVLDAGAVLGSSFDVAIVAEVCELDDRVVVDAVDEALDAALVEEVPDAPGVLTFGHQLVRHTLETSQRATRRALLHARVADALERRYGLAAGRWAGDLAHHRLESGSRATTEQVVWSCLAAAKAAMASFAYELAVERLERALAVAEQREVDEVERVPVLLALSHALGASGRRDRARTMASQVIAAARAAGRPDWQAEAVLAFAGPGGEIAVADPEIDALLAEAVDLQGVPAGLRVELLARLTSERLGSGALESARASARQALAVAERLGDAHTLAAAAWSSYYALVGSEAHEERARVCALLSRVAADTGDDVLRYQSLRINSLEAIERGDTDTFDANQPELIAVAERLRQPRIQWLVATARASRALLAADLAEAEHLAGHAFGLGIEAQADNAMPAYAMQLFVIRREQGRLMELAGAATSEVSSRRQFAAAPVLRAALASGTGGGTAAAETLTPAFLEALPRDALWSGALVIAAEMLPAIDDPDVARTIGRLLEPMADRHVVVGLGGLFLGPVRRVLGIVEAYLKHHDAAEAHLVAAIGAADAARAVLPATTARVDLAWLLTRRRASGDLERAHELASVAYEVALDHDLTVLAGRSRRMMSERDA